MDDIVTLGRDTIPNSLEDVGAFRDTDRRSIPKILRQVP